MQMPPRMPLHVAMLQTAPSALKICNRDGNIKGRQGQPLHEHIPSRCDGGAREDGARGQDSERGSPRSGKRHVALVTRGSARAADRQGSRQCRPLPTTGPTLGRSNTGSRPPNEPKHWGWCQILHVLPWNARLTIPRAKFGAEASRPIHPLHAMFSGGSTPVGDGGWLASTLRPPRGSPAASPGPFPQRCISPDGRGRPPLLPHRTAARARRGQAPATPSPLDGRRATRENREVTCRTAPSPPDRRRLTAAA